jgi:3-phosphoshikimate 1-carboxyvinyltransferase
MEGLLEALRHGGVTTGTPAGNRTLPLTIRGPLQPGKFVVDGAASSQFLSALLFVLPTLDGPSRVCITGPRVSRPYVAATLAVLAAHGVRVSEAPDGWEIPGRQRFQGRQFFVTGDASSAAYLWVAAALGAGQVTVSGLDPKWPQADLQVLEVLRELGARVRRHGRNITVEGPVHGSFSAELSDAPDLYPLLGVLAALQPGKTSELRGAPQARQKESDRRAGTLRLARALGAQARSGVDAVTITGGPTPRRLELSGLNDHRLFMSATVAALSLGGTSRLRPAEAPGKSFPGFLATLRALGGEVR